MCKTKQKIEFYDEYVNDPVILFHFLMSLLLYLF